MCYFGFYLTFSFATKLLASGSTSGIAPKPPIDGAVILPASIVACGVVWAAAMLIELLYRRHRRQPSAVAASLPLMLSRDVLIAASASAVILTAATLAYSLPGVSLLVPLLLMKGGVLLAGPTVDWLGGAEIKRRAYVVLGLAATAIASVLWHKVDLSAGAGIGWACVCAVAYVVAYFPKIAVMTRNKRRAGFLFAEMTMTLLIAMPLSLLGLWAVTWLRRMGMVGVVASTASPASFTAQLQTAADILHDPRMWFLAVGSEGCALAGGLIFMSPPSATLTVPLNRCTSLLAGFAATLLLWRHGGRSVAEYAGRNVGELVGVAAMLVALWVGLRKDGGAVGGVGLKAA